MGWFSPKVVELRDANGKLLQKTVQHTEDGPIEILFPMPRLTKEAIAKTRPAWVDLTGDEVLELVEENDWFNWPENFVKIVEAKIKEKNQCS